MYKYLVGVVALILVLYFSTVGNTGIFDPAGGAGVAGWPTSAVTKVLTWANSLANALRIGDGVTAMCHYTDATLGPVIRPCTAADIKTIILNGFTWSLWDEEGAAAVEIVDPDAATKNAMYQYGANYKPLASIYPSLSPRGAASVAEENLNTNFEKRYWATVTDVDTDALDFHFPVTLKMVGATTITVRLVGASKNAAPSGNIVFSCAAIAVRPGTDTYAAHSITGEVNITLTPATQYRPVAATSAAITLNGTVADGGEIVGSCEVDAGGTTSAQMTDFRLSADARIQLLVNSRSD